MAQRVYRNPDAVLRAAQRKLGGRLATDTGSPVLHLSQRSSVHGAVVDTYLSPSQAAECAGLDYLPHDQA